MENLKFKNGDTMPAIGLGTWKSAPGDVYNAVLTAIRSGYRHIDCAAIYGNEAEVGEALKKAFSDGLVKREELWVTSKLWNSKHREEQVIPALEQTLKDLQLEYVNLYLMHWPVALKEEVGIGFPEGPDQLLSLEEIPLAETWIGLEKTQQKGMAKHIGVSNFSIKKLEDLIQHGTSRPEMNQVEMHPYLQQNELVAFCKEEGIHITAYSPLGSGDRPARSKAADAPVLMEDESIHRIAQKHDCSPAQVLISWAVRRNTAVIPKSVNPERIQQNIDAAQVMLDEEDMKTIAGLDKHYRFINGAIWTMEGSVYNQSNLWDE
ncbi:aldo/keto reductase [Catalinimonas niigatensis]|uniref:aldo/keto reductase n=1 Tax=Catalinimonas niigatensis TaxID=1397264 RepID=UPI002666C492|nr:aldo/keto reductase [Catalinimonas niigatensis]WPP49945.1 aldo/keto reductase [Catalinimonas niigatensis]